MKAGADRVGMLLGLYEAEVLEAVMALPARYRLFIDLGAADGYYGVGLVFNGRFEKILVFRDRSEGVAKSLRARRRPMVFGTGLLFAARRHRRFMPN